jgi:hypothetical protein
MSQIITGEGLLDSLEGADIEFLQPSDYSTNDNTISAISAINPLTGKTESAPLVGDAIAQRQFLQPNNFEFSQPYLSLQNPNSSVLDQQNTNPNKEFISVTELTTSNVIGNRNNLGVSSVISNGFQLTDSHAFTPLVHSDWWVGR